VVEVGVGHSRSTCLPSSPFVGTRAVSHAPSFQSRAVGVGQYEQPLSSVARTGFRRAEQSALSAVTHFLQLASHVAQSERHMPAHVFKEGPFSRALTKNAGDVRPQVSRVICAKAFACRREWLTGIAPNDAIHSAAPRSSVERSQVRPDRRFSQVARFHARDQNRGGIGFDLHMTDDASLRQSSSDAFAESVDA
jgi:hypothetical protein